MKNFGGLGHQSKPSKRNKFHTMPMSMRPEAVRLLRGTLTDDAKILQDIEVSRLSIMSKTCHEHFRGTHLPKTQHGTSGYPPTYL